MKREWVPVLVLAGVLAFCLWNGKAMREDTERWQGQLARAERLADAGDWDEALWALERSHEDWQERKPVLRMVSGHGNVDEAEAMYRRSLAFARVREDSELKAELEALRVKLGDLAEMERFSWGNVL